MQVEQKLKRCNQYKVFLEDKDNLILFRKKYDMEFSKLISFIENCQALIKSDIELDRDRSVFLNELERCYQRVLKGEETYEELYERSFGKKLN